MGRLIIKLRPGRKVGAYHSNEQHGKHEMKTILINGEQRRVGVTLDARKVIFRTLGPGWAANLFGPRSMRECCVVVAACLAAEGWSGSAEDLTPEAVDHDDVMAAANAVVRFIRGFS